MPAQAASIPVGARICAAALLLAFAASSSSAQQEVWEASHRAEAPSAPAAATIQTGYLFIDREYVAPPYRLSESNGQLFINDRPVMGRQFDRWQRRPGPWGGSPSGGPLAVPPSGGELVVPPSGGSRPPEGGTTNTPSAPEISQRGESSRPVGEDQARERPAWPGFAGGRPLQFPRFSLRFISDTLESDGVVFAFQARTYVALDNGAVPYLMQALTSQGPRQNQEAVDAFLSLLSASEDEAQWSEWLATYQMPDSLAALAQQVSEQVRRAAVDNQSSVAAVRRMNEMAYPLSVLGMVAGVLALGHLLRSAPKAVDEAIPGHRLAELRQGTALAVGLIALMSGLDLVWTILSSQAGQMRELNPLGSHLIDDPIQLSTFKIAATLLSCGLLYALRGQAAARTAAWWLCLVCTVLTFRWLVVNSLFVL